MNKKLIILIIALFIKESCPVHIKIKVIGDGFAYLAEKQHSVYFNFYLFTDSDKQVVWIIKEHCDNTTRLGVSYEYISAGKYKIKMSQNLDIPQSIPGFLEDFSEVPQSIPEDYSQVPQVIPIFLEASSEVFEVAENDNKEIYCTLNLTKQYIIDTYNAKLKKQKADEDELNTWCVVNEDGTI